MPDNSHQKGPIGKKSPGPFARIKKFWNDPSSQSPNYLRNRSPHRTSYERAFDEGLHCR